MDSSGGFVSESRERRLKYEALEHLASIELIELCNEAKVEFCRATRDLRSCGRNVQHVLNSCRHASLCAECSQRCDYCPICRNPIPKNSTKIRLRLYNECLEAGLISKRYDNRFQEKDSGLKQLTADVQRLYSLFDVALENNLISLVCHYVTEVCMDENAVSSDPVLAFLFDEVVVKDWCGQTFGNIVGDLREIYMLNTEEMNVKLGSLLKLLLQLNGISNVLEVLESSFKDSRSAWLDDLYILSENVLRVKQHLEIMAWCIRHRFVENVPSCHPDFTTWCSVIHARKAAAAARSWPSSLTHSVLLPRDGGASLFIEDALSQLGIEQEGIREELEIISLQKDAGFAKPFRSKIEGMTECCYPFKNFRTACDLLFLRGSSDLVVAKQAIFLYYIYDRHWTVPDLEWRYLISDFASTFGITRYSLLECQTFYLLDDHTEQALQQACNIIPEIAGPETHPKIAQVLLERQKPGAALMVLRCSGRDALCACADSGKDGTPVSFREAVIAVRVRVECGLLTEAFMYQRAHCMKVKNQHTWALLNTSKDAHNAWLEHLEALVTEMCSLCVRRNLVDRMIEFPWNKDEEIFLHKYLLDCTFQDPLTTSGSLLVVYYLQRSRYIEAYEVDCKLQKVEQDFISKSMSEEVISRIMVTQQHRGGLVDKCIELLPKIQQEQIKMGNFPLCDHLPSDGVDLRVKADVGAEHLNPSLIIPTSPMRPSVLGTDCNAPSSIRASPSNPRTSGPVIKPSSEDSNFHPPFLLGRSLNLTGPSTTPQEPAFISKEMLVPNYISTGQSRLQTDSKQDLPFDDASSVARANLLVSQMTPLKELNQSAWRVPQHRVKDGPHLYNAKFLPKVDSDGSTDQLENAFKYSTRDPNLKVSGKRPPSDGPWANGHADEKGDSIWRDSQNVELPINGVLRWRTDDSSDDEADASSPERIRSEASTVNSARGWRTRFYKR
ncbi:E3 ubiquitin-protein ligase HOS1 isoform X2 [Aristolochia californica]|uniref:E3 ubiquitin-protein ligase HOS1 isoform X2 n=1 Tax=Aristolochia californica TaxID=171875 RepID=UPI0035E10A0D